MCCRTRRSGWQSAHRGAYDSQSRIKKTHAYTQYKTASRSKADHPRKAYSDTLFCSYDLDVDRWLWYKLRNWHRYFEDVPAYRKWTFYSQGFQKLEHHRHRQTDTQTDATENVTTAHSRLVKAFLQREWMRIDKQSHDRFSARLLDYCCGILPSDGSGVNWIESHDRKEWLGRIKK